MTQNGTSLRGLFLAFDYASLVVVVVTSSVVLGQYHPIIQEII